MRRGDIRGMLEEIAAKAPTSANRVLEIVRKMYNWAVERELCEHNPCYMVSRPSPENQRDRVLSVKEIHMFWQALNCDEHPTLARQDTAIENKKDTEPAWISEPVRLALKLALVTAQRRTEVADAPRSEFDLVDNRGTCRGVARRTQHV